MARMWFLYLITLFNFPASQAQNSFSEGTITYDISIMPKQNQGKATTGLGGATNTIYVKGVLARTEMASALGNETVIQNSKTGEAVILKEYSGQKLMITLTKENWIEKNKKYRTVSFQLTNETKTINGYNCKKAIGKLKDSSSIVVYYAPALTIMNKEFNPVFTNLTGFPMEYELQTEKLIFNYKISKIDFGSVPASKFDAPKSGYRTMTFDENQKEKKGASFL